MTCCFWAYCIISAYTQDYELKFTRQTNFDTLISNLKSYFQYKIVMTSLWRNIKKKLVKGQASLAKIDVYVDQCHK